MNQECVDEIVNKRNTQKFCYAGSREKTSWDGNLIGPLSDRELQVQSSAVLWTQSPFVAYSEYSSFTIMPRENRKRGKKHKKSQNAEEITAPALVAEETYDQNEAGPSWIVSAPRNPQANDEAPFGYVDAEVKAYFRTVDIQIRDWQDSEQPTEEEPDTDPNEGIYPLC